MTQGPYHLISTAVLLIFSYLATLFAVRMQLLSGQAHRKFWNWLLLLFFLSTASLGLLLAIKVNYKLNLSWLDTAMQWHVDLGIGLALVAFFHLTWNLRYYTRKKMPASRAREVPGPAPHLTLSPLQEKLIFLLLGYTSIMSQLVLLREFIKAFHGNELVIGIFLAIWMILTATGARAGSVHMERIPLKSLLKLTLLLALAPIVVYLLLILVNRFLFLPGYEPGLLSAITCMILLTGLLTLTSGFLFAYFSGSIRAGRQDASYYRLDSLGSLLAGIIFGLVLVFFLDNIQVLALLLFTVILAVILGFGFPSGIFHRFILLPGSGLLFLLLLFPGIKNGVEGWRYKGEQIVESRDTPYGNLTFAVTADQLTGYLDRNPVITPSDLVRSEESIHFAALQHPSPSSFLLLGGGISGAATEVIKYGPERFDYCEADPWIYRIGKKLLPEALTTSFQFIPMDGRKWLQKADTVKYDIIISAVGDPVTIGWNRFFTREFYLLVQEHLKEGGVFSMQLSTGGNYVNMEGNELLRINYHTLKRVFRYVTMVPGRSTYFLASSRPLSLDFPALLEAHNITTRYVNPDYMDVMHLSFDAEQLLQNMEGDAGINRDLWPRLFFSELATLESRMGKHSILITGIIGSLIFLMLLITYPPVRTGMYIAGFTGAGIQILLIIVLQSFYGYAYMVTPVMITLFMAGIVMGTMLWQRHRHKPSLPGLTALIWIMGLVSVLGVILLRAEGLFSGRFSGQVILSMLNIVPGIIVGAVYGMSVALTAGKGPQSIGKMYSADLSGAALGSFLPVLFLLPLIGVINTFILFCGINVATGLYLIIRGR